MTTTQEGGNRAGGKWNETNRVKNQELENKALIYTAYNLLITRLRYLELYN